MAGIYFGGRQNLTIEINLADDKKRMEK